MSKRQRLRKARKTAAKEEELRRWQAQKRLYRVSFPWKQLFLLLGSLVVAGLVIWFVPKGVVWMSQRDIISGEFGSLSRQELEENRFALLKTTSGDIKLEFMSNSAPKTVANFILLTQKDFYDGVKFHRVIDDFMIQTGDPLSLDDNPDNDGIGGPGYQFADEFNNNTPKLVRGVIAMANSGPNTNGSQFFIITREELPSLDGQHTPFGIVVSGMDIVDQIGQSKTIIPGDKLVEDVIIEDVILSSD